MAGHLIRRLNQISTHVFLRRTQEAGFDLTPVQFAALAAIRAQPGLDQAGIAAKIAFDRATIGGVVERLLKKGYVKRTISRHDRRAREIRLTSEGRSVYDQILPIAASLQAEILAGLDPDERREFLRLARKAMQSTATADGKIG
ncbi:MarR family winged helix-turn-helix transcriptional regulator [Sedimentitalea todarodis]|uniref:MarR family winged helix-turn-helix transcriptional regulator n=1 Tax=Sedimentitalea todarodis TaxID=1631240 RepID=A0ABU3VEZ6_9RHOB|nr:MarR family winged helix-turn-helix transcriptional regulator [Sedimentitalea todarodis]MDU9004289.1 MarR family winged helix-turn-helix transcriptional regulator [Sedimentitalea todarodis]